MTEARAPSLAIGAVALPEDGRRQLNVRPELLLDRPLGRSPFPLLGRARRLLHHIDRCPGLYLPRAAGVALAALIAFQCATLYGVIVTPLDGPPVQVAGPPQLQPATLSADFDPFSTAAGGSPIPIAATDLTLHGLRQDRRSGGGSAIISQSNGAQRSFGTGEEIAPGIILKQVGFDHVVIVRHGLDERLAFKEFKSTGSAATPPARSAPSPYAPPPAAPPPVEVRAKRPASRGPTLPARSIDFADPSTLPVSLTTPKS